MALDVNVLSVIPCSVHFLFKFKLLFNSAIVLFTTLILIMHLSVFRLYKCIFYYLLCMLCDNILLFCIYLSKVKALLGLSYIVVCIRHKINLLCLYVYDT